MVEEGDPGHNQSNLRLRFSLMIGHENTDHENTDHENTATGFSISVAKL